MIRLKAKQSVRQHTGARRIVVCNDWNLSESNFLHYREYNKRTYFTSYRVNFPKIANAKVHVLASATGFCHYRGLKDSLTTSDILGALGFGE